MPDEPGLFESRQEVYRMRRRQNQEENERLEWEKLQWKLQELAQRENSPGYRGFENKLELDGRDASENYHQTESLFTGLGSEVEEGSVRESVECEGFI